MKKIVEKEFVLTLSDRWPKPRNMCTHKEWALQINSNLKVHEDTLDQDWAGLLAGPIFSIYDSKTMRMSHQPYNTEKETWKAVAEGGEAYSLSFDSSGKSILDRE